MSVRSSFPMSSAAAAPNRSRWRWRARLALAVGLVAVVAWQARVHTSAWRDLKEGRAALARDDAPAARAHLDRCLESWPQSAEAHFLAGRAARKCASPEAARKHLAEAARFGYPATDVEVEQALLRAQTGDLAAVAPDLLRHVAD